MVVFMAWFLFIFLALPIIFNIVAGVFGTIFVALLEYATKPAKIEKPNEDPYLC